MMLGLVLALALAQGSSTMAGPPPSVFGGGVADYFSSLLTSNPATECACADLLTTAAEAVTTTRASTAFCTASTGVMTSCTNNKPRVSNSGLLVEGARTNLLLRSQEFDNGSWATGSTGSGTTPTVTANAAVAPDGTTTAEELILPAVAAGSNGSWIEQAVTMTAVAHGASLYVKGAAGTGTAYFFATPDDATYLTVACAWNSTTWTRCTGTGTATAATWYWKIGSDGRAAAMSGGIAAQTIYIWGGQVEAGAAASTYVPTAGTAVARSGERHAATLSIQVRATGCFSALIRAGGSFNSTARVFAMNAGRVQGFGGMTALGLFDGTGFVNTPGSVTIIDNELFVRAYWDATTSKMLLSLPGASSGEGAYDGTLATTDVIHFGTGDGGGNELSGFIRQIKIGTLSSSGCNQL